MTSKALRDNLILFAICLLLSSTFVLLFSFSTSPLYSNYFAYGGAYDSGDSLQFLTIGNSWRNGKVPYRDSFDHKGPFIFLVDMLGFLLGGETRYGIVIIQSIFLTISLFFVYKISELAIKNKFVGCLSVLATLFFYSLSYVNGNSVQEYNLPFIVISTYFIVHFLSNYTKNKNRNCAHKPLQALFYGITVGICFCTQITNAILVCAGILLIIVNLIINKRYTNLRVNIIYGFIGLIITLTPFALYFALNGCFDDFIFGTLVYNIQYAKNIGSWLKGASAGEIVGFLTVFFSFTSVFITAIFAFYRKQYYYFAMLIFAGLLEGYLFLSAQCFSQYATLSLVQIPLLINEICYSVKNNIASSPLAFVMAVVIVIMGYNQVTDDIFLVVHKYRDIKYAPAIGYEELIEPRLTDIKKNSFISYGDNNLKGVYLRYNIPINNKYFAIQEWHSSFSEVARDNIERDFISSSAKYVLFSTPEVSKNFSIYKFILDNYTKVDSNTSFSLYMKNDN